MYHHLETTVKPIKDKILHDIKRLSDSSVRVTLLDDATNEELFFELSVEGDCCSHSIFYDIVIPEGVKGSRIVSVEEHVTGQTQEEAREIIEKAGGFDEFLRYIDTLSVWDVVLKTTGGNALLRHINHSNGYYEGYTRYTKLEKVEPAITAFAKSELALLGDDEMQRQINENIMAIVELFASQGHIGMSAGYSLAILDRLLRWKPLQPLTGEPDEWNPTSRPHILQNKRCSTVFLDTKDGRAYNSEGFAFRDENGACFTSKDSRIYIEFPYLVPEGPEIVEALS